MQGGNVRRRARRWSARHKSPAGYAARIESVLDWATVRGYRQGDNPSRWKGHLAEVPACAKVAAVERHPTLAYADLPAFMVELRSHEGVGARALEFTILTRARSGEVLGARWSEIDLAAKLWIVPAGRMKAAKEHRVALSQRAIDLLRSLPTEHGSEHVFIGPRGNGLGGTTLVQCLRRMGRGDVSVHGFRSTFRDWATECTNFPREVCELALAHKVGPAVEHAYQRGDSLKKRFNLAEAWARYCRSSSPAKAAPTAVPMHALGVR
jgi:integrase